jgi:hypothetical protein
LILSVWLQERNKNKKETLQAANPLPANEETTTHSGEANQ